MPPKRKGAATKKASGGKKAKQEDDEKATMKEAFEALKAADAGKEKKTKVDKHCPYANSASVLSYIILKATRIYTQKFACHPQMEGMYKHSFTTTFVSEILVVDNRLS